MTTELEKEEQIRFIFKGSDTDLGIIENTLTNQYFTTVEKSTGELVMARIMKVSDLDDGSIIESLEKIAKSNKVQFVKHEI